MYILYKVSNRHPLSMTRIKGNFDHEKQNKIKNLIYTIIINYPCLSVIGVFRTVTGRHLKLLQPLKQKNKIKISIY